MATVDPLAPPSAPPPGLINTDPNQATQQATTYNPGTPPAGTPQAASYTAATYDPATAAVHGFTVDRPSTVSGQIEDIIASGSPLMQQAEAKARETMNARGLMNSSLAVTAGQEGLINTALPIAQQDATTYATAGRDTTMAKNAGEQFNAGQINAAGQFNTGQSNAATSQQSTQQNSLTQTRMNNESAIQIQQMQNQANLDQIRQQGFVNEQLANISSTNKLQLQQSAGASQLYSQALQAMAQISANPNLDAGQKEQALNNSVTQLQDALNIMSKISGLPEYGDTLTFYDQQTEAKTPDAVWPPPEGKKESGGGGLLGGLF